MSSHLHRIDPTALSINDRVAIAAVFACLVGCSSAPRHTDLHRLLDWFDLQQPHREAIVEMSAHPENPLSFAATISSPVGKAALLWDLLTLAIVSGAYDAREREAIRRIANAMHMPWHEVARCENSLVNSLVGAAIRPGQPPIPTTRGSNALKVACVALGGGVLLAFTGGIAAPAIGGAIGTYFMGLTGAAATSAGLAALGGGAVAAGGLGMAGGTAAVATLLGVGGAAVAGSKMRTLTGDLAEFAFEELSGPGAHVNVCVSGWLSERDDLRHSWAAMGEVWPFGHRFALRWESKHLYKLGSLLTAVAAKNVAKAGLEVWAARASRAAATALAWPMLVINAMDLIDNPWHVAASRAKQAGRELARVLAEGAFGRRPVSLYGFSLGAQVIFHALEELARNGSVGLIDHVVLMGGAITADPIRWLSLRSCASGRVVNVYCRTDWVLAYLYRPAQGEFNAAGLQPIELTGVESIDATDIVGGHLGYRANLAAVLSRVGVDGRSGAT